MSQQFINKKYCSVLVCDCLYLSDAQRLFRQSRCLLHYCNMRAAGYANRLHDIASKVTKPISHPSGNLKPFSHNLKVPSYSVPHRRNFTCQHLKTRQEWENNISDKFSYVKIHSTGN
jgi:hypothetical protein